MLGDTQIPEFPFPILLFGIPRIPWSSPLLCPGPFVGMGSFSLCALFHRSYSIEDPFLCPWLLLRHVVARVVVAAAAVVAVGADNWVTRYEELTK